LPATSILEQVRIGDFVEWYQQGKLELNPAFQRGPVWTPAARIYLIDTVLRQLPIPKIYMRTMFDVITKKSTREVVDGQQRLRAILDFADGKLRLSSRAAEFKGLTYDRLDDDLKQQFLSYPIAVDQLVNASDSDVLEVFARLNSYTVTLNAAEKRHAAFQGAFKTAVRDVSAYWRPFWEKYGILTIRDCVRMQDDQLVADMFGVAVRGVVDFSQQELTHLYRTFDKDFPDADSVVDSVDQTLKFIDESLSPAIIGRAPLSRSPQFYILFAAVMHARNGIPNGQVDPLPRRDGALSDLEIALANLDALNQVLSYAEAPADPHLSAFYLASEATTQRISSRNVRFQAIFRALLPDSF